MLLTCWSFKKFNHKDHEPTAAKDFMKQVIEKEKKTEINMNSVKLVSLCFDFRKGNLKNGVQNKENTQTV